MKTNSEVKTTVIVLVVIVAVLVRARVAWPSALALARGQVASGSGDHAPPERAS